MRLIRKYQVDLAHVVWGILTPICNPWLFTFIMLLKQVLDWRSGTERWKDTSRDIGEFCCGVAIGYLLKFVFRIPEVH